MALQDLTKRFPALWIGTPAKAENRMEAKAEERNMLALTSVVKMADRAVWKMMGL